MNKAISIVIGAAILSASATIGAQTSTMSKESGTMSKQKDTMQNQIDFKAMDVNSDGMISREEYVGYYGTRFDGMKRTDKGMVMMQDMHTWDGARAPTAGGTSNITNNPVTNLPGTKAGSGNPPATGGGSK